MSHWAEYVKERFNWSAIETDRGTIIYSIRPPYALIHDLFVTQDSRIKKHGTALCDEVARIGKEQGCTHLWSQVAVGSRNATEALKANLAYGFCVTATDDKGIILMKEIGN